MPKQLIHEGRTFHLIPMKEPDGSIAEGSYLWGNGFPTTGSKDDGVIVDQEPSAYLSWSKGRDEGDGGPGDTGYIQLEIEFTEAFVLRLVEVWKNWGPDVPRPDKETFTVGPLSWRDINVLARTARDARDGAFGKPE